MFVVFVVLLLEVMGKAHGMQLERQLKGPMRLADCWPLS